MAQFKGTTSGGQKIANEQEAEYAPFLPGSWWKPKAKIAFTVLSLHKSHNGPYMAVRLVEPVTITVSDGRRSGDGLFEVVHIGNLAGIGMARVEALAGAKNKKFAVGDRVFLCCTGITPPEKPGHSPSPNFEIEIDREEDAAEETAAA